MDLSTILLYAIAAIVGTIVTRGRWDPEGFAAQTPQFVTGVQNGTILFGYSGQRTADMSNDIRIEEAE